MKRVLPALFLLCALRSLPGADFIVVNTNDSGPGSLRQAITDANNTAGADRILFNIRGPGVQIIAVSGNNPLPTVVESLEINGYSQPSAEPNSLQSGDNAVILIQIDGGGPGTPAGANFGLMFSKGNGNAPGNYTVRGLSLTGFGTAITSGPVDSLIVAGNFIGVLPDGETAEANRVGVGHVTQLGGTDPSARNIISGNTTGFTGELSSAAAVGAAVVEGNYMGTDASGTKPVPNTGAAISLAECGITQLDLTNTLIAGNLISGNNYGIVLGTLCVLGHGIPPDKSSTNGVRIEGNTIIQNQSGINIVAGSNNVITGNAMGYNDTGVIIIAGTGNQISGNYVYLNRRLGIDLNGDGVTPNDINDTDSGPNNRQNFPVINSVTLSQGAHGIVYATVAGTLNSTPDSTFRLEFFISGFAGASGFGEGELYNGNATVSTDASGNASFSVVMQTDPGRRAYSATATDSNGNTSEFSPAYLPAAQLLNLSTRTPVGTGENVLIGGFIVAGTDQKKVLLRGLGPSLNQAGINGALADPTLELRDSTGVLLAFDDNWKDSQANEISQAGLAPAADLEAAILATLPAKPADQGGASYTGILAGNGGKTGIGVLEIYDIAGSANSKLLNISTRGFVGGGEAVLIGGVIPGPADRSPTRVLIRGIGPSLAAHGVTAPLQDPLLEIHDGNGTTILQNDNWADASNASEISMTGIPPTDDRESAILTALLPGSAYTAVVSGANGGTGVALVEVYALN